MVTDNLLCTLYLSCSAARQDIIMKSSAFGVRRCSSFFVRVLVRVFYGVWTQAIDPKE